MSQRLVPISDLSSGGWLPTPVYVQLDEETPSEADLVESPELPGCQAFSVTLTPAATPPIVSTAGHMVSARLKKEGEGCAKATVTLLEDGTPIASRDYDLTDEWGTYSFELDAEEAASITDYEALVFSLSRLGRNRRMPRVFAR